MRFMHHCRTFGLWLIALPAIAAAHHSALYDDTRVVSIEGTITAVAWVNPHVRLTVEVIDPGGRAEAWSLEGGSVNVLERWGIEPTRIAVGDRVRAEGPVSLRGAHDMIAATLALGDGTEVVLRPDVAARLGLSDAAVFGLFPPPASPRDGVEPRGIFRVWTPRERPSTDPKTLPLTAAARAAAGDYDALEDDPALRCEPPGMPLMLETLYPVEFVDRGDRVLMRFEEWAGERTIYMDPRNGPPTQEPSPAGVSFGRWEGKALAIFTTYIDTPYFDRLGTPLGRSATVLERYTPSEDERGLRWQATVTDPATFTAPVVLDGFMAYEPGETVKSYDCTVLESTR